MMILATLRGKGMERTYYLFYLLQRLTPLVTLSTICPLCQADVSGRAHIPPRLLLNTL